MKLEREKKPDFSGRIGRKACLVLATLFALVLVGGGVSILLTKSILESTDEIGRLSEDIKRIDQIHFTAHHLVDAISYAMIRGVQYPGEDFSEIISNLGSQVEDYLKAKPSGGVRQGGLPEKEQELEVFRELMDMASNLTRVSGGIFGSIMQGAKPRPKDLENIMGLIYRVHAKAEQLTQIHQAQIRQLIQMSSERMRLILIFYLTFVLVGSLVIVVGSFTFSRAIVSPLRRLAAATHEIASGSFDRRVPVSSKDEIGQLSYSFNVMAERLAEHEAELRSLNKRLERKARESEALYKIGTEVLALLDLNRILHSVVEKAKELLSYEVGALCLLDEEGGRLIPKVTSGPSDAFNPGESLRVDQGPAAEVIGLCPSARAETTLEKPVLCSIVKPEYLEAHLAVPLKRGEKVIGAFCIGDRRPREFSPAEVDLLLGLSIQASLAIENARLYEKAQSLAILEERERIAREMHDGLAQTLGSLHLKITRAQELLDVNGAARAKAYLEETRKMAEGAYEDVRQSIFGLRIMVSRSLGLVPTLTEYLHEWSVQNGIAVDLQIRDERATRFPPEAEVQLIRIVQEALTNVRKHARAAHAWVRFEMEGDRALVTVADDGRGFDIAVSEKRASKSFGLESMRERAESIGGSLEVQSRPGKGTTIIARLSVADKGDYKWKP